MQLMMFFGFILAAVTAAFIIVMLATIFNGKVAQSLQSAGASVLMAAATVYYVQQNISVPVSGIDGIGWIVGLSGDGLLGMYVFGGTLLALGLLGALVAPVRMYQARRQSERIKGVNLKKPGFMGRRRDQSRFGKRTTASQLINRSGAFKKSDD